MPALDDSAILAMIAFAGLRGGSIFQIRIDHAFSILGGRSQDWLVRFEGDFRMEVENRAFQVFPGRLETIGEALSVFERRIEAIDVRLDGQLTVTFGEGCRILAGFSPLCEAWEAAGPVGAKVVCVPGGGLAVWTGGNPS